MNVTVNGRSYAVAPAGADVPESTIAELYNSRGEWAAMVVRDSARPDSYVLMGSPFKRVPPAGPRQVGRAIARELGA